MLESTPEITQLGRRSPNQRWQIYPEQTELALSLATVTTSPIVSQLLINRGIKTLEDAQIFLDPESLDLPNPVEEFPDLAISLELLQNAITSGAKIAICGDYDADGMTSTALLLRSLRWLDGNVNYAIPSRMHEGYGINKRIVEEFHSEGVELILTVDNGISAFDAIARARELGLNVIVTDHHDIPQQLPPANAILNPKLISPSSPYHGVAGVGVAYIVAVSLAQQMEPARCSGNLRCSDWRGHQGISTALLELFTLGTIADLASLTGVNRRWVKSGLHLLPKSKLPGVQALIQMSGVQAGGESNPKVKTQNPKSLKPEDIGFRLGPRINAIGRIGDPQTVIELLTTDDMGIALERAKQCEEINLSRQEMCKKIEAEAIALVETMYAASLQEDKVLVVVQPNWHHGVIGIVASRLVERYGVPVFIGTEEGENLIRGSARGIPEFHIFAALEYCQDLLGKFGGHKAAGGFSFPAVNLQALRSRLSEFANQCLLVEHLKPLLKIDALVNFNQINHQLYQQLNVLEPCGIENPDPIFWTSNVQVVEQEIVGKDKIHVKMTLAQSIHHQQYKIKAIAWRWRDYFPLPPQVDVAYKLRENDFNGNTTIELELLGFRLPNLTHPLSTSPSAGLKTTFEYKGRHYTCGIYQTELRIINPEGIFLVFEPEHSVGLLGTNRTEAQEIDVSLPQYNCIIQAALQALEVARDW